MINGVGTPFLGLLGISSSAKDGENNSLLSTSSIKSDELNSSVQVTDIINLPEDIQNSINDSNDLIGLLQKGRGDLVQNEKEFLREQLSQLREQLEFFETLVQAVTNTGQLKPILSGIEDAVSQLEDVGGRYFGLGNAVESVSLQRTELQITNISASFNLSASISDGEREIAIEQSVEFNFTSISFEQQNLVLETANPSVANADNPATQPLTSFVEKYKQPAFSIDESFVQEFNSLIKGFTKVTKEIEEFFFNEDRVPPSFITVIKNLSNLNETNDQSSRRIDTVA